MNQSTRNVMGAANNESCTFAGMELGQRVRELREREGWSQEELAKRIRDAGGGNVQQPHIGQIESGRTRQPRYLLILARVLGVNAEWLSTGIGEPLPENLARLTKSTRKLRDHDINSALTHTLGVNLDRYYNVGERRSPAPNMGGGPRNLEVRGTAASGDHGRYDFRFNGEIVDYVRRPPRLEGVKSAFVIYLQGDSMVPRYKAGEAVYIHPGQPPRPGDDVLVELHPERDGEPGGAMVKQLVARTPSKLRLKQHNPPNDRIEVDLKKVKNLYRVVPYSELLDF